MEKGNKQNKYGFLSKGCGNSYDYGRNTQPSLYIYVKKPIVRTFRNKSTEYATCKFLNERNLYCRYSAVY